MKVDFVSDLHFNHWMLWTNNQLKWESRTKELAKRLIRNGHGEVLIIAGDFSEWNCQTLWILEECANNYERVYFTYGNHDLYIMSKEQRKKYKDSMGRVNELIEVVTTNMDNVIPLIKTVDEYKGKIFAGDVMWYLPKRFEDWQFFKDVSSDSNYININGYSKEDGIRKMWKDSMEWYDTLENTSVDVFVSHVPPVHNPHSHFEPNSLYMVDVPFINASHWVCGHDHFQGQFTKADVDFHMNAIGYPAEYRKHARTNVIPGEEIDDYKTFDLKTFEI